MRRRQAIYLHFKLIILLLLLPCATVLDPLDRRIADRVKTSEITNYVNTSRPDKELLSPRATGAASQS